MSVSVPLSLEAQVKQINEEAVKRAREASIKEMQMTIKDKNG